MITDYFTQRGLKTTQEVSDARFTMFNDGSVPCEDGELLYSFVRRLKPQNILETGTYAGYGAAYMGLGVRDNGFGRVFSIEYEQFHIDRAQELWGKLGLSNNITCIKSDSMQYKLEYRFQLMFLDTEPFLRFKELVKFYPNLDEGGYVFIHDTPRNLTQGNINPDHPDFKSWPFGEVPKEMRELLDQKKLMPFYFGHARGLVGYYKVHKQDYI